MACSSVIVCPAAHLASNVAASRCARAAALRASIASSQIRPSCCEPRKYQYQESAPARRSPVSTASCLTSHQARATRRLGSSDSSRSMKRAVENWETGSNVACLLSCCFLSPLSIVEDTSFVTPHHLGVDGSIFLLTALSLPAASSLFDKKTVIP